MSEDCLGARFEILLDGKTQHCRVTMNTAMGAANIIQRQNSNAGEKFRMLVTLICSPLTTMAPRAGYLNRSCDRAKSVRVRPAPLAICAEPAIEVVLRNGRVLRLPAAFRRHWHTSIRTSRRREVLIVEYHADVVAPQSAL